MSVTATKTDNLNKDKKMYPCLMEGENELIVLFTDTQRGTVVYAGKTGVSLGRFSPTWTMDNFRPYYGKIVLKEEICPP